MKDTQYSINTNGIQQISKFLAENHRLGGDHFTDSMLSAWAAEAEFQLSEGNPPTIELRSFSSIHGCAQEFTISVEGLDSEEIEMVSGI